MPSPLRVILNTFLSGPQAWFFVAEDRGYFADHGIEVVFTPGDTLANAVPKVASGAYDIGYGDMNALIELHGARPDAANPVAVFIMHNASPYTIAVAADGPIRTPKDLAGQHLLTHPNDAALRMFPEFIRATGLDASGIAIIEDRRHHRDLTAAILRGEAAGLFGFVNTLASAAIEAGIAPADLRHFEWRQHVPALCGAAIIASPDLVAERPDTVRGFVSAVNRAVKDVIADPDAAVEAVRRRDPTIDVAANKARLMGTLALEMAHPEGARLGLGDIDPLRLDEAIDLITAVKDLPARPESGRIFDRSFLPPDGERIRTLAKAS
ncbi:ABC transporter substrate-binding protein [Phreatobacter aquaticus]|uniref:ABC transporter substrate-binding protein n=1 Tax=Phreatobacter aquaticus TaxID=2570229 RepID=A0A4D7QIR9_9HYPH|nr:ABC transporter substrate-binding protein [Phreatobacter aquaticus]QCK87358.1 ABC transporter substrate-binding protein [Phreatobacter aquaticus]